MNKHESIKYRLQSSYRQYVTCSCWICYDKYWTASCEASLASLLLSQAAPLNHARKLLILECSSVEFAIIEILCGDTSPCIKRFFANL